MLGIAMHHVKEYEIRNEYILAKSKKVALEGS
jgi:hypothetical protein